MRNVVFFDLLVFRIFLNLFKTLYQSQSINYFLILFNTELNIFKFVKCDSIIMYILALILRD